MAISSPFVHETSIGAHDIGRVIEASGPFKAFVKGVHDIDLVDHTAQMFNKCTPRVICAPLHRGKTTELNLIRYLFRNFPANVKRELHLDIQGARCEWTGERLRREFAKLLEADEDWTLLSMVASSNVLCRGSFTLLTVDAAEQLPRTTLSWLLANIRHLEMEGRQLLQKRHLQLVVAGRFSLKTLRRSLNSPFRSLGEVTVSDFDGSDLRDLQERLDLRADVRLTDGFAERILEYTAGDKYLVQRLADKTLDLVRSENGPSGRVTLTKTRLNRAIGWFEGAGYRDDRFIQQILFALSSTRECLSDLLGMREDGQKEWIALRPDVRAILYDMGVIKVEDGLARYSSECVKHVVFKAIDRADASEQFLSEVLPLSTLLRAEVYRRRKGFLESIWRLSFRGDLPWVYYGEVTKAYLAKLSVHFRDSDGNEFVGSLDRNHFKTRAPTEGEGLVFYGLSSPRGPLSITYYDG